MKETDVTDTIIMGDGCIGLYIGKKHLSTIRKRKPIWKLTTEICK